MSGLQLYGFITIAATLALLLVCLVLYARVLRKRHFKCPYCGFRFKPASTRVFFSASQGTDKLMRCPNCGQSGYMECVRDGEDTQDEPAGDAQAKEPADTGKDTDS